MWQNRGGAVAFVLALCSAVTVVMVFAHYSGASVLLQIFAFGSILTIAWICHRIFLPHIPGTIRVQFASLTLVAVAAVGALYSNTIYGQVVEVLTPLLVRVGLSPPKQGPEWLPATILSVVGVIVIILNVIWKPTTITPPLGPASGDADALESEEFRDAAQHYCEALVQYLTSYDKRSNWNNREYTNLEAEVEVEAGFASRRRLVSNLVEAIRHDRRAGTFVVLGDPGSGKSVSLRRLARLVAADASRTKVLPVYANLREYRGSEVPTASNIEDFLKWQIEVAAGRDAAPIMRHWDLLRRQGRLFLIIDSFDELPAVLDADENTDQHRDATLLFDGLFRTSFAKCRRVLASRPFRQPKDLPGRRILVRPFGEWQVRAAMNRWLGGHGIDVDSYIRDLYANRQELVPWLSNPFSAALLAEYARSTPNAPIPARLGDLFERYLMSRFAEPFDARKLLELGLSADDAITGAACLAYATYASNGSLEMDLDAARATLKDARFSESVIDALVYSRIARSGDVDSQTFSFVHRRFAEYFAARWMNARGAMPLLAHVPRDSRLREVLVIQLSIADPAYLPPLAARVMQNIKKWPEILHAPTRERICELWHWLRLCIESPIIVASASLSDRASVMHFVLTAIRSSDPLESKVGADAIRLLPPSDASEAVCEALGSEFEWTRDAAFRASCMSTEWTPRVRERLYGQCCDQSLFRPLRALREIEFLLRLNPSLWDVRLLFVLRNISYALGGVVTCLGILMGITGIAGMTMFILGIWMLVSQPVSSMIAVRDRAITTFHPANETWLHTRTRTGGEQSVVLFLATLFVFTMTAVTGYDLVARSAIETMGIDGYVYNVIGRKHMHDVTGGLLASTFLAVTLVVSLCIPSFLVDYCARFVFRGTRGADWFVVIAMLFVPVLSVGVSIVGIILISMFWFVKYVFMLLIGVVFVFMLWNIGWPILHVLRDMLGSLRVAVSSVAGLLALWRVPPSVPPECAAKSLFELVERHASTKYTRRYLLKKVLEERVRVRDDAVALPDWVSADSRAKELACRILARDAGIE